MKKEEEEEEDIRRRTITTRDRRACARRRKLSHQFSSHSNCAPWCTCRHNHNRDRLYQRDLFRFSTIQCHGVIDLGQMLAKRT